MALFDVLYTRKYTGFQTYRLTIEAETAEAADEIVRAEQDYELTEPESGDFTTVEDSWTEMAELNVATLVEGREADNTGAWFGQETRLSAAIRHWPSIRKLSFLPMEHDGTNQQ